ncbi:MAG: glycosyltransferase [Candidatus Njordarchaeia archaeon]
MNKTKYVVVIPARKEREQLYKTLLNLSKQNLPPIDVIVVNDGGDKESREIVEHFGYINIDVFRPDFNATGTKIMPALINIGLRRARKLNPDYIGIMGADHIIPANYFETIIKRMNDNEKIAIASGVIAGESIIDYMPRGSGRVISVAWWKRYNVQYIVAHGWEPWLVYMAIKDGYLVRVYRDLVTYVSRKTTITPRKLYYYGRGARFIGHSFIYLLGRSASYARKNIKLGAYLLAGYISESETCNDTKRIVRLFEKYRVAHGFNSLLAKFL